MKEDEVDMLLLLLRSPLPSSDRPEPGRDLVDISRFGFSGSVLLVLPVKVLGSPFLTIAPHPRLVETNG